MPVAPAERVALLLEELEQLSLRRHEIRGNPAPLLATFVSRIDRLKRRMISPGQLTAQADAALADAEHRDDAARTAAQRDREFAGLYADHDRLLADRGALDTGDLVLRAFTLLHEHPHVRSRVAGGLAAVLVDDYQDTDFAQRTLLALLCEERREVSGHRPRTGAGGVRARVPRRAHGVSRAQHALPTGNRDRGPGGHGRR